MGEQLIECEKNLATQMQTIGLRLPGQRMCKYLPVETLKEPQALRKVLEARIFDALHVMFLVDPQFKTDFSWCTIFHVPVLYLSFFLNYFFSKQLFTDNRKIRITIKSFKDNFGLQS